MEHFLSDDHFLPVWLRLKMKQCRTFFSSLEDILSLDILSSEAPIGESEDCRVGPQNEKMSDR